MAGTVIDGDQAPMVVRSTVRKYLTRREVEALMAVAPARQVRAPRRDHDPDRLSPRAEGKRACGPDVVPGRPGRGSAARPEGEERGAERPTAAGRGDQGPEAPAPRAVAGGRTSSSRSAGDRWPRGGSMRSWCGSAGERGSRGRIRTSCGTAAATLWRKRATTRGRFRRGWDTGTSSTRSATRSWLPADFAISGAEALLRAEPGSACFGESRGACPGWPPVASGHVPGDSFDSCSGRCRGERNSLLWPRMGDERCSRGESGQRGRGCPWAVACARGRTSRRGICGQRLSPRHSDVGCRRSLSSI
jgi:hypothetical protein